MNYRIRSLMIHAGIAVAATVNGIGCAPQLTQTEMKFLETRELDGPDADVYEAALNAMFSMGLSIQHTDKQSGIITGQSGDHVQRASVHPLWQPLYPVKKVTLMITPKGARVTQIRMKVLINEQQQLDRKLMTEIWQRIEREALLESRPSERAPTTRQADTAPSK